MAGSTLLPRIGTPSLSNQVHQWKRPAPRGSQVMGVAEVWQRRRARPVWTSLCMAGRLFTPQGGPFRSTCPRKLWCQGRPACGTVSVARRPHLESRERPQTSAPQVEPKTALQALERLFLDIASIRFAQMYPFKVFPCITPAGGSDHSNHREQLQEPGLGFS